MEKKKRIQGRVGWAVCFSLWKITLRRGPANMSIFPKHALLRRQHSLLLQNQIRRQRIQTGKKQEESQEKEFTSQNGRFIIMREESCFKWNFEGILWRDSPKWKLWVCVCVCACVCVLCFLHCFKTKCEKFPLKWTLFPYPMGTHCRILQGSQGRKKPRKSVWLINEWRCCHCPSVARWCLTLCDPMKMGRT